MSYTVAELIHDLQQLPGDLEVFSGALGVAPAGKPKISSSGYVCIAAEPPQPTVLRVKSWRNTKVLEDIAPDVCID